MSACAKHFPGTGTRRSDSHHELPSSTGSRAAAGPRFRPLRAIAAGVRTVMSALSASWRWATSRPPFPGVHRLLRGELGFDGVVITDALEMAAVGGPVGMARRPYCRCSPVRTCSAWAGGTTEPVAQVTGAIVAAVPAGPGSVRHGCARPPPAWPNWRAGRPHRDPVPTASRAPRRRGGLCSWKATHVSARTRWWSSSGPSRRSRRARPGMASASCSAPRRCALAEGDALPPAGDRPLVLALRDAHRHTWQRELVGPGAVVVETGVPVWRPSGARAYVATFGAGRVNLAAAADALRG